MTAPVIDHVGVVVADLEAAIAKFRPLFPDGASMIKDLPDAGVRVAMLEAANVTIEFIELTGDGPSLGRSTLGEKLGINHISARVGNVDATIDELGAAGFALTDGFPTQGAHGKVAFFDPDDVTGLLFEVCQED